MQCNLCLQPQTEQPSPPRQAEKEREREARARERELEEELELGDKGPLHELYKLYIPARQQRAFNYRVYVGFCLSRGLESLGAWSSRVTNLKTKFGFRV